MKDLVLVIQYRANLPSLSTLSSFFFIAKLDSSLSSGDEADINDSDEESILSSSTLLFFLLHAALLKLDEDTKHIVVVLRVDVVEVVVT